jgi:hypothetical protein
MYFINVYNQSGKAVILADIYTNIASIMQRAYYEHGLTKPDYSVFQTKEAALAEADKCSPKKLSFAINP